MVTNPLFAPLFCLTYMRLAPSFGDSIFNVPLIIFADQQIIRHFFEKTKIITSIIRNKQDNQQQRKQQWRCYVNAKDNIYSYDVIHDKNKGHL